MANIHLDNVLPQPSPSVQNFAYMNWGMACGQILSKLQHGGKDMDKRAFLSDFFRSGALMHTYDQKLLVAWGNPQKNRFPSSRNLPSFYFSDFFLTEQEPWLLYPHVMQTTSEEFIQLLEPFEQDVPACSWHNPYQDFFKKTLDNIKERIYLQELLKAVPCIFEISNSSMISSQLTMSLISGLKFCQHYPSSIYGCWDEHQGILGTTPEILFFLSQNASSPCLTTFALAGTKCPGVCLADLKDDPKIRHEHQLVVQGIQESLSPYGPVQIGPIEELKLRNLVHLKTPIEVKMNTYPDIRALISELHPTPALGAYPRTKGMHWLKEYQQQINRKRFGAPAGYMDPESNETCFYVAIRNVQWTQDTMQIGAGCGIVEGSCFETEWEEINAKLNSIKGALAL
jgi:isochorismate synthase EntC